MHPRLVARTVIDPVTGCHEWQGARNHGGYGVLTIGGRQWRAHRFAWAVAHGPIPDELLVLHHCDNPRCTNVEHLFLGTAADNHADRNAKQRQARGARHGRARLTAEQVREIRRDPRPHPLVAADYGVGPTAIGKIKRREHWSHLP